MSRSRRNRYGNHQDHYDHDFYPESRPISTDKGLKAKSKRGEFTENWWAGRWIQSLERLMDANRLGRGKRYARQGQVLSIEEQAGAVVAAVQGSRTRPYRVDVELDALTDDQWERIVETLSQRPLFTASLLAGEMPEDIEEAFTAAGVGLFPERGSELTTRCSCPDSARVCKHTAAVHYILGERFDEDPFLLFRLRGRSEEQLVGALSRISEARSSGDGIESAGTGNTQSNAPQDASTGPSPGKALEQELDRFWQAGPELESVKIAVREPAVELSVLRRLGQPSFVDEDLVGLLSPGYEAISRRALEMAHGEEVDEQSQGERLRDE
jgi:uncharacterized Zn finger protein